MCKTGIKFIKKQDKPPISGVLICSKLLILICSDLGFQANSFLRVLEYNPSVKTDRVTDRRHGTIFVLESRKRSRMVFACSTFGYDVSPSFSSVAGCS